MMPTGPARGSKRGGAGLAGASKQARQRPQQHGSVGDVSMRRNALLQCARLRLGRPALRLAARPLCSSSSAPEPADPEPPVLGSPSPWAVSPFDNTFGKADWDGQPLVPRPASPVMEKGAIAIPLTEGERTSMPSEQEILAEYEARLQQRSSMHLGYPYNLVYDHEDLHRFLRYSINNLGDPFIPSNYGVHSREFECSVIDFFAELWKAPKGECALAQHLAKHTSRQTPRPRALRRPASPPEHSPRPAPPRGSAPATSRRLGVRDHLRYRGQPPRHAARTRVPPRGHHLHLDRDALLHLQGGAVLPVSSPPACQLVAAAPPPRRAPAPAHRQRRTLHPAALRSPRAVTIQPPATRAGVAEGSCSAGEPPL